jgi:hypothetical protein
VAIKGKLGELCDIIIFLSFFFLVFFFGMICNAIILGQRFGGFLFYFLKFPNLNNRFQESCQNIA